MRPSEHELEGLPRDAAGETGGRLPSDQAAMGGTGAPAPDGSAEEMCAIWSSLFGRPVGPDDDFYDMGGSSVDGFRLLVRVGRATGADLTLSDLARARTPRRLAALASSTEPDAEQSRCIVSIAAGDPRNTVVCVHGLGGSVGIFGPVARRLAPRYAMYGAQAIGLDHRLTPDTTIDAMASRYVDELLGSGSRPRALIGYSMGGWVALAMSGMLAERGNAPECVVLLDSPVDPPAGEPDPATVTFFIARTLRLDPMPDWAPDADVETRWEQLLRCIVDQGVFPAADAEPQVRRLADLYRVHLEALQQHELPASAGVPVQVYAVPEARSVAEQWRERFEDVDVVEVPGDHHSFMTSGAEVLATALAERLPASA